MKTILSFASLAALLALSSAAAADVAPKLIHPLEGNLTHHVSSANPGCGVHTSRPSTPAPTQAGAPKPAAKR